MFFCIFHVFKLQLKNGDGLVSVAVRLQWEVTDRRRGNSFRQWAHNFSGHVVDVRRRGQFSVNRDVDPRDYRLDPVVWPRFLSHPHIQA